MFDSPLSASAYEILGVDPSVDDAELRRAYRLRLRQTHPDTGGDAAIFIQVQRAWELVGTVESRAAYDRRSGVASAATPDADTGWSGWRPQAARTDTRPRARSYGHPGGWRRERYLVLIREWRAVASRSPTPTTPPWCARLPAICADCSPMPWRKRPRRARSPTSAWASRCGTTWPWGRMPTTSSTMWCWAPPACTG